MSTSSDDHAIDHAMVLELTACNEALQGELARLRDDLKAYDRRQQIALASLVDEIETQKILSRFARRTWFEVMTYLVLGSLLLNDVARAYAHNGWWGLLFWTAQHGHGGPWEAAARLVGFAWQGLLLIMLGVRAQVPEALMPRVPAGVARESRLLRRRH